MCANTVEALAQNQSLEFDEPIRSATREAD